MPRGGGIYCLLSADFLLVTWELLKYHLERHRGQGQAMKGDTYFAQRPTRIIYSSQFLTWHALHKLRVSDTDRKFAFFSRKRSFQMFLKRFRQGGKYCTGTRFVFGPFSAGVGPNNNKALILKQKAKLPRRCFWRGKAIQRLKFLYFSHLHHSVLTLCVADPT
jgi:hypothetical protein